MRIAMMAQAQSVHTVRWVNALVERGLQIDLISLNNPAPELSDKVRYHKLPFSRPFGYFLAVPEARRLLRRLRPDLLHAHYASGYGTLARLCNWRPMILSVWGSDVYTFPKTSVLHRRLVRHNIRHADRIFSTSKAMAKETIRLCGPLDNVSITPFGIDTDLFRPRAARQSFEEIVIGTVKTLRPVYGIDTLVRGFASCQRQLADSGLTSHVERLRLKIVGGGHELSALEKLVTQLGVAHFTQFVGAVPHRQVPEKLSELDIYVAVSRSESFGVSVLEASAMELPVVVSNVGGLPEVVLNERTGVIVPTENPEALAVQLTRLVENDTLRQQLGEAGRRYVIENYRWEDCVSQVVELYQEVVRQQISDTRYAA